MPTPPPPPHTHTRGGACACPQELGSQSGLGPVPCPARTCGGDGVPPVLHGPHSTTRRRPGADQGVGPQGARRGAAGGAPYSLPMGGACPVRGIAFIEGCHTRCTVHAGPCGSRRGGHWGRQQCGLIVGVGEKGGRGRRRDVLDRPYAAGGGGVTPPAPPPPPPPPPLPMFEADSQHFASAPSVPRALRIKIFGPPLAGTIGGPWEEGGPSHPPPPPPSNTSLAGGGVPYLGQGPPPPPYTHLRGSQRRLRGNRRRLALSGAGGTLIQGLLPEVAAYDHSATGASGSCGFTASSLQWTSSGWQSTAAGGPGRFRTKKKKKTKPKPTLQGHPRRS